MLKKNILKNNSGLIFLIIFVVSFLAFKYYLTNNVLLGGDEVSYNAMALDSLDHQEFRVIDTSEFPGTKFNSDVYLTVPIITVISTVTGVPPFYVVKFFVPAILFFLSIFFFYVFSRKITKSWYFSILLTVAFFGALLYHRGNYSINTWYLAAIPQNISYVYFLIINFLIFGTDILKKRISGYDLVIVLIILSWAHLHLTYLIFGLAYYLFIFLFREEFFYPKNILNFYKNHKISFILVVCLLAAFLFFYFFPVLSVYLKTYLSGNVKIPFSFISGTAGKYLFVFFLLLMIYKIIKINRKNLTESLVFLFFAFAFLFLMFLNPTYLNWISVNDLYYRFIGYFIVFLYLSLVMFMGIVFKQNKKTALVLAFFIILLSVPQLKPYNVDEDLQRNLIVIQKEKELFNVFKKLPRNSVFIESSVNPYIELSLGFSFAYVPCWLDYLNNPAIEDSNERLNQLTRKRLELYSIKEEKDFYNYVVEAIEKCYKYRLGPGVSSRQQSGLFGNDIMPIEQIPYDFYYVQSKKRLEKYYLDQYKNNNYPLSEIDLLRYIHSPNINGEYFERYYGNDEFIVWKLKKTGPTGLPPALSL